MSNEKNDGGPAFPEMCNNQIVPGMSMRDFFAAQALEGVMRLVQENHTLVMNLTDIARIAYEQADAMLKARAQ
jgi:hypothetical protein